MTLLLLILGCLCVLSCAKAQYASTYPAPIPLFHKSPYFNAWIGANNNVSSTPETRWAQSFTGNNVGWFIGIRVDNTSYLIQGGHENYTVARTVGSYITATRTIFTIDVGPVRINMTYLTPIELQDWTLHSLPFVYLAFDVWSTDSRPHSIQLYTDVTGEFVSSNHGNLLTWNTTVEKSLTYHQAQLSNLAPLTENSEMADDGAEIFAFSATPGINMTWQTCFSEDCRISFVSAGKLANTSDTRSRAIGDSWPVFAFALDLANITETSNPLVFALGLVRDPVVRYRTANEAQNRSHLWYARWKNIESAVNAFLSGYSSALSRAIELENAILSSAGSISSKFGIGPSPAAKLTDLLILNLRQTVGSLEFTTSKPNRAADVRVFMKDVGNSRRTNPVEVIYASFPAFLYLNASIAGALLRPLLEFQSSDALYKNNYSAPDLGSTWPIIQGNATDQSLLAVDSCGSMLIMSLSYAQKSGDGSLLFGYYDLLRKWADYLVGSMSQINAYVSSDGLYSNTNLALKGIMGLYAMGRINKVLEPKGADPSWTSYYEETAKSYVTQWQTKALVSDHLMSTYGVSETWALMYNLYATRLIGASSIIPEQIFETQATWYALQSTKAPTFGLPYDSTQSVVKAHWTLFSAASIANATSIDARDSLIRMAQTRPFLQTDMILNPTTYLANNGSYITGVASPAMGAVYAFFALNLPYIPIKLPDGSIGSVQSTNHLPAIIGGTVGGLGGLILIVGFVLFLRRRRRRNRKGKGIDVDEDTFEEIALPEGSFNITPFVEENRPLMLQGNQPSTQTLPSFQVRNPSDSSAPVPSKKISTIQANRSSAGGNNSTTAGGGNVVGSDNGEAMLNPGSNDLRREVDQLRMAVETLTARQEQVHDDAAPPDEPPPVYGHQP